uniref:Uncharacterized protein n=1 Tax=Anopheles minimus TaxID=112268 RepID=A0A182WD03_9DIPT
MCEVATLTDSKQQPSSPLLLVGIMGQTSSSGTAASNNNNNHLQHSGASRNGKKMYHRHSSVQPALASIRLLKKENSLTVGGSGAKRDAVLLQKARTESRNIDQYGLLLANGGATGATNGGTATATTIAAPSCPSEATTASNELTALLSSGSAADVDRSATSVAGNGTSSREFFKSGDDTYHRTDFCYYRTMDNGYHKLPSDSYHKTTEGCYVKMADGSFRRLDYTPGSATDGEEDGSPAVPAATAAAPVQYRVRNPMMKFLKRSKSHTPATIAQLQKEKEQRDRKAAPQHHRLSTIQSTDGADVAGRQQAAVAAAALLQHAGHHHHHHQKSVPTSGPLLVSSTSQQPVLTTGQSGQQSQSHSHSHQHHAHHHHHHHTHAHPPSASSIVEQQTGSVVTKQSAAAAVPNHQNRRVMVTMIDGGLPVVAKSKPIHDKPKSAKARVQEVKRDKRVGA